ncbi:MAG: hypothetical protein Q4B05_00305 [Candidatus Saccharibacteria bacterium]|nr:hypothetical protein [Candidatus Saccharibacteria bacterium]
MNIAICLSLSFDKKGPYKYLGDQYRQFREALSCLAAEVLQKTGKGLHFVQIDDLQADGSFGLCYTLRDTIADCLRFEVAHECCMPDVVINRRKDELYNHPYFANASWLAYNAKEIAELGNKAVSLREFSHYMPKGTCFNSDVDIEKIKDVINQNPKIANWVVKPLRENGGRGIFLLKRDSAVETIVGYGEPVLLQEFCETRSVSKLQVTGRHDIRAYVIDGEPLLLAIRQPKEGGFLANTAAGGSIRFLDIALLPVEARNMLDDVVSDINTIKNRYFVSVDIFYADGGWRLIEINDQPGLPAPYQTPLARIIIQKLIESLEGVRND